MSLFSLLETVIINMENVIPFIHKEAVEYWYFSCADQKINFQRGGGSEGLCFPWRGFRDLFSIILQCEFRKFEFSTGSRQPPLDPRMLLLVWNTINVLKLRLGYLNFDALIQCTHKFNDWFTSMFLYNFLFQVRRVP